MPPGGATVKRKPPPNPPCQAEGCTHDAILHVDMGGVMVWLCERCIATIQGGGEVRVG